MAIEVQLSDIFQKPSDFKVCKACKRLNWYENEACINIDCNSHKFDSSESSVLNMYTKETDYWICVEDYGEKEADRVFLEV